MRRELVFLAVAAATWLVAPAAATAQDYPAANVSAGYAALKDTDTELFGRGWSAAAAGAVSKSFEVVADFGANYRTDAHPGLKLRGTLFTYMGGVRYMARPTGRVSGFVQAVAGGVRLSADVLECGSLPQGSCDAIRQIADSTSRTYFAIQPGVGADAAINRRVGVRFQVDYRAVLPKGDDEGMQHEFRFGAGLVFSLGSRR